MFATMRSPPSNQSTNGVSETIPAAKAAAAKDGYVRRRSGELDSLDISVLSPQQQTPSVAKQSEKPSSRTKATSFTVAVPKVTVSRSKDPVLSTRRVMEARGKITETKRKMDENLNMKKDVKAAIHECMDTLLRLLKESEETKEMLLMKEGKKEQDTVSRSENETEKKKEEEKIVHLIEGHSRLLRESKEEMEKLKEILGKHQEMAKGSYASVAAAPSGGRQKGATVHSVVVSSNDEKETGEQVLEKIRIVVNAREEGVKIDKIRKAKDRKVIIGCGTREEMGRVKEKLKKAGRDLSVEEIKNKDPLVILKDVMKYNKDEEIIKGMKTQNRHLFLDIEGEEDRIEVKYRRKARNPLAEHVVLKVSPKIWSRLIDAGALHIDLQKVKVADQSPLIQCARCLGYGHGKRFCREPADVLVCSHCGGPHLKMECTQRLDAPKCVNCAEAKIERVDHNAFSEECPVRRRWDALARAAVQYC